MGDSSLHHRSLQWERAGVGRKWHLLCGQVVVALHASDYVQSKMHALVACLDANESMQRAVLYSRLGLQV